MGVGSTEGRGDGTKLRKLRHVGYAPAPID